MQKYRDIIEMHSNILDLSLSNIPEIKEKLSEVVSSKFRYLDDLDSKFNVVSLVSKSDTTVVYFPELEYKVNMKTASVLLFYEKVKYEISNGEVFLNTFEIDPKEKFGNGKNEYRVTSIIRDIYKIRVMADSEKEAQDIANSIDLDKWHHLDIDRDLPEIKLTKFSRWGNLIVDKLS
jgi:hypothetical protein